MSTAGWRRERKESLERGGKEKSEKKKRKGKGLMGFLKIHNQQLWASVRVPTDSVPTTQSPKRRVGTIAIWPQARACFVRVERGKKREGFDSWMVWR